MSERYAVQNPMIKYAQQIGCAYVRSDEALRLRGADAGYVGVAQQAGCPLITLAEVGRLFAPDPVEVQV